MANKKKSMSVMVSHDVFISYRECAAEFNKTVSEMTRELVEAFVDGRVKINRKLTDNERKLYNMS